MLLSFGDYQRLAANQPSIIELLAEPKGVEDIDLEAPSSEELAQAARFN